MSTDLKWKVAYGEWRFSANGAAEAAGGGVASVRAPSADFAFSIRMAARFEKSPLEVILETGNDPRKMHMEPAAGVFFRGDAHSESGYLFSSTYGKSFRLERMVDGKRTMLASGSTRAAEAYGLTVFAVGDRLLCFVDGRKVADVTDSAPLGGEYVGLLARNIIARYEDASLNPAKAAELEDRLRAMARQDVAHHEKIYGFRCHVVDLKGRGGYVSVGDLDGDGRTDFVATQGNQRITAVTWDGDILWSFDHPEGFIFAHPECQMPTTIYDIDGDGANEVVCRWYRDGQEMLQIREGRTGAVKREMPWIRAAGATELEGRIDHLAIANLRGREFPQDIVITTCHWGIYTFTDRLEPLWSIPREDFLKKNLPWLSHHPCVDDIDGDGCDEVATGGMLVDHDGTILWAKDLRADVNDDNVDSVRIADVDGNVANGKEIAFSSGACLLNAKGEYYWRHTGLVTHGQMVRLGKVRADVPGVQMLVLDCDRGSPGTYLFSAEGEILLKLTAGFIDLVDWNGDGLDEIACGTNIYDGHGRVLAELPVSQVHTAHGYTHGSQHFIATDVVGDAREELVWASGDLIVVFENIAPNSNLPLFLTPAQRQARWKKVYNNTRY